MSGAVWYSVQKPASAKRGGVGSWQPKMCTWADMRGPSSVRHSAADPLFPSQADRIESHDGLLHAKRKMQRGQTWAPKKLRDTRQSRPPMSACPPAFCPACSAVTRQPWQWSLLRMRDS